MGSFRVQKSSSTEDPSKKDQPDLRVSISSPESSKTCSTGLNAPTKPGPPPGRNCSRSCSKSVDAEAM